jgi:hypothetical protein
MAAVITQHRVVQTDPNTVARNKVEIEILTEEQAQASA